MGARTFAFTVILASGTTGMEPMKVRAPSHTWVVPEGSYQWYERLTGFEPPVVHGSSPVFVRETETWKVAVATIVAGTVGVL